MRWTNRSANSGVCGLSRGAAPDSLLARVTGTRPNSALSLLSGAAPEKHLSVYSVAANYSLPLVQREGRDYVGLLEVLEPLGKVSAKSDNARWRLRYNNVEGDFQIGKTRARIQGRDADLGGKFLMENNRGLVPSARSQLAAAPLLGGPVTLHEESGRLFIGNVATHFTASLSGDNPPRLVFISPRR